MTATIDTIYAVGLRDVKVYPITSVTAPTYGTGVDLPAAATMELSGTYAEVVAEGDDMIVAHSALPNGGEFTLESSAGLSLSVLEVMLGGTAANSGASPNEVSYWDFTGQRAVPYFGAVGKAIDSESGGDTHVVLYKGKVTSGPGGAFAYNAFRPINWSGRCLPMAAYTGSPIFRYMHHRTAVNVPSSFPGIVPYNT